MAETLAIIGGTGLYELDGLSSVEEIEVNTPFGPPSSPIRRGKLAGTELLFIARHGPGHVLTPSEVNSRANIFALKSLGASWCISVSAVGSLKEEMEPGHVVIPDQIIDRTRGREHTFFGRGLVAHVPFATPFCPTLADLLLMTSSNLASAAMSKIHRGGTYVCMEGPAFSTRAESNMHRSWGASVIGMTAIPEAKLAREAEISYATLAMVTDYDCWRSEDADVDVEEILATMAKNVSFAKNIISSTAEQISEYSPSELASNALAMSIITPRELVPDNVVEELHPIIGRYMS